MSSFLANHSGRRAAIAPMGAKVSKVRNMRPTANSSSPTIATSLFVIAPPILAIITQEMR